MTFDPGAPIVVGAWLSVLQLVGGMVYLLLGGDLLVRGAIATAKRANVSPMLVGLTVVALGTSAPELVVTVNAALSDKGDLAIGNVVGSNIANVLLVLGVPALIYPLACNQPSLLRDALFMIGVSVLFVAFCVAGPLGTAHGLVLLAVLAVAMVLAARGQTGVLASGEEAEEELNRVLGLPHSLPMIGLFIVVGIVALPLGADLTVDGASDIARGFGVSDAVIGLSLVAIGTSLPELGTTLVAAFHRSSDVAIGNVVGSNVLNILAILGVTSLLTTLTVPASLLERDLWLMLGCALVVGLWAWRGWSFGRRSGAVMLVLYLAYMVVLFQPAGS